MLTKKPGRLLKFAGLGALISVGLILFLGTPSQPSDPPFEGNKNFTYDPVVGHRPSRNVVLKFQMAAQGGALVDIGYKVNNLGLVSSRDINGLPSGKRVLLIGDSHLMGVVNQSDNAAEILERSLEKDPGNVVVFNASSGLYSLYQLVLRARAVVDKLRPGVLVTRGIHRERHCRA
jgi:hypothetical protein